MSVSFVTINAVLTWWRGSWGRGAELKLWAVDVEVGTPVVRACVAGGRRARRL